MARKERNHVGIGDAPTPSGLRPKHLTKQEFAQRLHKLRLSKGWSQSELARQSDLPRDSISVYMRGKSLPTAVNLHKLAKALGTTPEELLPNYIESAIDEDQPAFEMKVSTAAPDKAWLRVNRLVSLSAAVKIAEILQNDDALDRSRGRGAVAV